MVTFNWECNNVALPCVWENFEREREKEKVKDNYESYDDKEPEERRERWRGNDDSSANLLFRIQGDRTEPRHNTAPATAAAASATNAAADTPTGVNQISL